MANSYTGAIGLRDHDGDVTTRSFNLGEFDAGTPEANYLAAYSALDQVRGALVDVTECDIAFVRLTEDVQLFNTVPNHEDARNYVNAAVVTHLNAPGTVGKYHTIYIPGPVDAIWMGDEGSGEAHKIVDVTNPLLQAYILQLSQHTFVSDGEQIDTTAGTAGIRRGRRISRAVKKPTF